MSGPAPDILSSAVRTASQPGPCVDGSSCDADCVLRRYLPFSAALTGLRRRTHNQTDNDHRASAAGEGYAMETYESLDPRGHHRLRHTPSSPKNSSDPPAHHPPTAPSVKQWKSSGLEVGLGAAVWSLTWLRLGRPQPASSPERYGNHARRRRPPHPAGGGQSGYGVFGIEDLKHLGVPQLING